MKIKGIIKNLSFLAIAVFMTAASASAQINGGCRSLNNTTTTTTENFDTLGTATTTPFNAVTTVPTGFGFVETGTNANTTYRGGTGSDTTGDTFSFGAAGSNERAFGTLRSGSLISIIGGCITNNGTTAITSITINFTGEQFRLGATGRADRLDFEFSTDATTLTSGTFTAFDALDFSSPTTTGTVGALDGNATANRTVIAPQVIAVNIPVGGSFVFRFLDVDATGADDGLAIDDFTLAATFASPTSSFAAISGTVNAPQQFGTSKVLVTLTDMQGNARSVVAGKTGGFRFRDVTVGETYILSVSARGHNFEPKVITVVEDMTGVTFEPID